MYSHFAKGQALYYLKDFDEAKKDLSQAIKIEPNNGEVKKTLKLVTDQLTAQKEKEKQMYGKMFK
jgi:tetratricopeptide (TPR) repeat protein